MSRIGVRTLLLLAFLALLFVSSVTAFNPYSDEDDSVAGEIPQTSTVTCTVNADGSETCTSVNKEVLDEATLEAKVAEAEAERAAEEQARNEARAKREAEYQREREEKREARRKKQEERKKQHQENKDNTADSNDYKIASPLKKLRINYYQFFRVDPDASKLKIRKAANAAALMNHPDKCPSSKCKENMIIINQARDVLLDDNTRAEYDFLLRFGFKIYDKELYDDIYAQYKEDPDNVQHGWDDAASFDGSSDYSGMQVTEEGAGWLLLITGSLTLAMMAWPVIKFWEQSKTAEEKKAAQKKILLEAQSKNKLDQGSLKKKTEKYTGERSAKRFASNDKSAQKSPVA